MSPTNSRTQRRGTIPVLIVLVIAALLRGAALYYWSGHLSDDRDDYLSVAEQYAAHGFWNRFDGYPNSFRPPLFPLAVAAILKCAGGPISLGLFQLLLGTATVALTYWIGKRLGLGLTMSLLGAISVALDPLLIQYTTFPMTETLFTFLLTLLVGSAVSLLATPSSALAGSSEVSNRSWLGLGTRAACVGIVFGACALCRPTIWATAGLAAIWGAWRAFRLPNERARVFYLGGVTTLFAILTVLPWGLRNWKLLGTPILSTTHGGYTLLLGNNHDFFHQVVARPILQEWSDAEPDRFQKPWFRQLISQMEHDLGIGASETVQDRWMYDRAKESIAAEPGLFFRASGLRFLRFWNVLPLPPSRSAVSSLLAALLGLGYTIELALFVVGLVSVIRQRDALSAPLVIVILSFTLVHLVYWSNMRMRAPLVPLIGLLAARGFQTLVSRRNPKIDVQMASARSNT